MEKITLIVRATIQCNNACDITTKQMLDRINDFPDIDMCHKAIYETCLEKLKYITRTKNNTEETNDTIVSFFTTPMGNSSTDEYIITVMNKLKKVGITSNTCFQLIYELFEQNYSDEMLRSFSNKIKNAINIESPDILSDTITDITDNYILDIPKAKLPIFNEVFNNN